MDPRISSKKPGLSGQQYRSLEVLIPAHYADQDDPFSSSSATSRPTPTGSPLRSRSFLLLSLLASIILVNTMILSTRSTPIEKLSDLFMAHAGIDLGVRGGSVAAVWHGPGVGSSAEQARLSVSTSTKPSRDALRSSLVDWKCSQQAAQWSQRLRSSRQLAAQAKRRQAKTAEQAGGVAKLCRDDFESPLPQLSTVLTLGGDLPIGVASPTKDGFTLTMPVTLAQLAILEKQCRYWKRFPLVAAIYIPLVDGQVEGEGFSGLDDALTAVLDMAARLQAAGDNACRLRADVVTEELCKGGSLLPLNALRNRALRMVTTRAVVLADGGHVLSRGLGDVLHDPDRAELVLEAAEDTAGVVIPAVASASLLSGRIWRQMAAELADSRYKSGVINHIKAGHLHGPLGWDLQPNERAAAAKTWASFSDCSNVTTLGEHAAPHAIVLTQRVPWFDERMRGGHMATALHVRHIEALAGTRTWTTLTSGWAVRVSKAGDQPSSAADRQQATANAQLHEQGQTQLAAGQFQPLVGLREICYN